MLGPNYFIDSNIFLRPIVKDDSQKTQECELFFNKIKQGKIQAFTSNLVLAEIVWTGLKLYKIQKQELIDILKGILDFKNLKIINNFNPYLAVEIFEKFPVKFIDALIASNPWIYQRETVIISYDRDFDKINIIRKEPNQIIKS